MKKRRRVDLPESPPPSSQPRLDAGDAANTMTDALGFVRTNTNEGTYHWKEQKGTVESHRPSLGSGVLGRCLSEASSKPLLS